MPTIEPVNYPAELERIAKAAMRLSNPGTVVGAMDGIILREAASELARLTLSEVTLRAKLKASEDEVDEACEALQRYRGPHPGAHLAPRIVTPMSQEDEWITI